MHYKDLLVRFVQMSRTVLGENLIGVYLHGSLAMGCFNPKKSDLDLILVVHDAVSNVEKTAFLRELLVLNEEAPEKGFELSIVKQDVCKPFMYPTPFEFHFSNGHREAAQRDPKSYIEKMRGTDKDLGAHFTIIHCFGVPLYGPPVEEVFAPVPKYDYFDSIWYDIENAAEDIQRDPVYITLNLCRVLGYVRDGLVLSKKDGGAWGVQNVPQYSAIITAALENYANDIEMQTDEKELIAFARFMIEEIKRIWMEQSENA